MTFAPEGRRGKRKVRAHISVHPSGAEIHFAMASTGCAALHPWLPTCGPSGARPIVLGYFFACNRSRWCVFWGGRGSRRADAQ